METKAQREVGREEGQNGENVLMCTEARWKFGWKAVLERNSDCKSNVGTGRRELREGKAGGRRKGGEGRGGEGRKALQFNKSK